MKLVLDKRHRIFEAQSRVKKLHPVLRRVAYYAVNTCGVFAPVFLRNSPDSQKFSRSGSDQQFLQAFDLRPLLVFGSTVYPLLQPQYNRFCSKQAHVRPFPVRVVVGWVWRERLLWGLFSLHRLTSPQITSLQMFQYRQDQSDVSTLSGWVSLSHKGSPSVHYKPTFASSDLSIPLHRPPLLRLGYR